MSDKLHCHKLAAYANICEIPLKHYILDVGVEAVNDTFYVWIHFNNRTPFRVSLVFDSTAL